ncbi:MAG: response regulator, partial [Bdellovibrionales bacterium]|nr:response regulator [Bdellovibrionales bacterium]
GREGLELVYQHAPRIVLCDLMMPEMDGKEFLIKLRSNPKTRDLPVIMLTAVDSESNEIDLLDLGANDFVSKASSSAVMLSRLRKVLLQCH